MPLFSVIIPTFNRAAWLSAALASVFRQDFTDYEIIVVDDGSHDETPRLLESYGSRLRVIRQVNAGPGAARNAGAAQAAGDYLAFLDSDDLWLPWTLATYAQALRRFEAPAVISGHIREFRDDGEILRQGRDPLRARYLPTYLDSGTDPISVGAGQLVISRHTFARVGGFTTDRINAEDHDLALRLGTERGFLAIESPVTVGWRRHGGSETAHLGRSFAGCRFIMAAERAGRYPGGRAGARARARIITAHVRPVSIALIEAGAPASAWRLYWDLLPWTVALGQMRYVLGFPLLAAGLVRLPSHARPVQAG